MSKQNQTPKKRKLKPMEAFFLMLIFGASFGMFGNAFYEVFETINLWRQIEDTKSDLVVVQEDNDYLTAQRDKLKDPNYVEDYARGNYLLSKEGETIFYLPSDENKPNQ